MPLSFTGWRTASQGNRRWMVPDEQGAAFTCPRCGMTSHHPDDVREGYCGHCHDWTGEGTGAGT